jgi:hypothetical protein
MHEPRFRFRGAKGGWCSATITYYGRIIILEIVNFAGEPDQEIYLMSDKGTKLMKPEKEFLELVNLPNSTKN